MTEPEQPATEPAPTTEPHGADRAAIRVLIADDQAMIRGGLRLILEDQPDITVVAEAADGVEAVALARQLRPDVCLVDIRMPRLDGIEVTRALAGPDVDTPLRVVVVTTFDLDEYVYGALRGGAVGFVLKGAAPGLLVEAVRAAHAGDALISPSITLRLLRHVTAAAAAAPDGPARPPHAPLQPPSPKQDPRARRPRLSPQPPPPRPVPQAEPPRTPPVPHPQAEPPRTPPVPHPQAEPPHTPHQPPPGPHPQATPPHTQQSPPVPQAEPSHTPHQPAPHPYAKPSPERSPRAPVRPLSEREIEVVHAIARGRTNQEIAAELFITLSTVKSHVSGIQTKLGVRNRVEIAAWAWEHRMIDR